jgi:cysteine synthase B
VEPADELQIIEGLKHMESAIVPGIYQFNLADRKIAVAAEDAFETALDVAKNEGMFVGFSAGAAIFAARQLAKELDEGVIVAVLPDSGERYLSMPVWE